jgi:hypothetical protein
MAPKSLDSPSAMKFGLISTFSVTVAIVGLGGAVGVMAKPLPLKSDGTAKTATKTEAPAPKGLSGLLHAGPERVKARLGEPAVARAEGRGAFWTYRAPRCALYIFLKDEGAGLKVSGAAAGPRRRGVAYPELDACIAELEQSQGAGR